jgi:hypothetical protein
MKINDILKNNQYAISFILLPFIMDVSTICTIRFKIKIYDHSTSVTDSLNGNNEDLVFERKNI